jgi:hypothetical protein
VIELNGHADLLEIAVSKLLRRHFDLGAQQRFPLRSVWTYDLLNAATVHAENRFWRTPRMLRLREILSVVSRWPGQPLDPIRIDVALQWRACALNDQLWLKLAADVRHRLEGTRRQIVELVAGRAS